MTPPDAFVDIVFDGPPGLSAGRFVEVERLLGTSIRFGEWVHRPDGYWVLRIPSASVPIETPATVERVAKAIYAADETTLRGHTLDAYSHMARAALRAMREEG